MYAEGTLANVICVSALPSPWETFHIKITLEIFIAPSAVVLPIKITFT